ncbi:S-adenosylmethionine-dependent methyltransferase [Knoellia flava TL1]|uniref:Methyltransferase n=2 Tax=Knoellia flava TaxID=913969 RepID=A0A8H9FS73_9MICO|nr:class I SAM-dependent methyltransferase [Knoellia flava]KGN33455.1 S-adenosylmethionine-dependent methyltransferase [Knoellia flava TL1]GGB74150.1 methyltransferase [Knoellia flava]
MSEHGHFDDAAATWDDDPAKVERAHNTAALLADALPLRGDERVLEIGGGTGRLSLALADRVGSVLVTDASEGMVDVARTNIERAGVGNRLDARRLDLVADPLPEERFDGAWAQLALHHVEDLDTLLGRVHELLVPGGWLAVVDLDDDRAGAFHAHHDNFTGHHGFDRDAFAERLRRSGFRDVSVRDAGSVEKELGGDHQGRGTFGMFLAVGHA